MTTQDKEQLDPREFMLRMQYTWEMESKMEGLNLQRERIFTGDARKHSRRAAPVHDVDFYVVLLRRLYREIEHRAHHDSRVANLKGKYQELGRKIKMRDHFEHGFDQDKLKPTDTTGLPGMKGAKGVVIMTSVFLEKGLRQIVSGNFRWDLDKDHEQFVRMVSEMVALHPFVGGECKQRHMKYQNVAVSAFIPQGDKVLIVQRAADEDFLPDSWEQVGGKIEWGETPFDGLIREVKEEAGIAVKPMQVYWLTDYTPNGERHMVEAGIICEVEGNPQVQLSNEHQAYRWVTEEEVKNVSPMTDSMREEIIAGFVFLRQWKK